jgi:hypothetical protein
MERFAFRVRLAPVSTPPSRGLPPRIYLPILTIFAVAFLALMAYLLRIGLGNTGTVLGPSAVRPTPAAQLRGVSSAPPGASTR